MLRLKKVFLLTDVINVLEGTRASFNIRNNKYEIIGE